MSYMETQTVIDVRDEPDASSVEQRSNHDDSFRTNVRMWTNMIRIISNSVYCSLTETSRQKFQINQETPLEEVLGKKHVFFI